MPRKRRNTRQARFEGGVGTVASPGPRAKPGRVQALLPYSTSSFIGRTQELREIQRRLREGRLVTLTGAGGSGKTRLALEAAHRIAVRFADGATFVAFDSIADPQLVPQTVAAALGVVEKRGRSHLEALRELLHDREPLLVLDNCEHLVAACATLVTALLEGCPALRVLATSREALGIAGEYLYSVQPLKLPAASAALPLARVQRFEAVSLFAARAHAVNAGFVLNEQNAAVIADICRRLDGMPLAIELAAARMNTLSVDQIAARLHDRFQLLTTGSRTAPHRHQTLQGALDWSYELLSDSESRLFEHLAVFSGGLTLEAAERVCGGVIVSPSEADNTALYHALIPRVMLDVLSPLVAKSLVTLDTRRDEPRFRMLETIRQYAFEKLTERGVQEGARDGHLDYYCELAERAEPELQSTGQVAWFNRLEWELDNLRSALDWALTSGEKTSARTTAGLRLAAALLSFWDSRGYTDEGIDRLKLLLAQAERLGLADQACAKALHALGALEWGRGRHDDARGHLERALVLGHILGDQRIIANALRNLGSVLIAQGEFESGVPLLEQSIGVWRQMGEQGSYELGWSLTALGGAEILSAHYASAQTALQEAEQLFAPVDNKNYLAYVHRRLGQVALHQKEPERALLLCRKSLVLNIQVSSQRGIAACVAFMAAIALEQGQPLRAAKLLGSANSLLAPLGEHLAPVDQAEFEAIHTQTTARLGAATFDSAFAQGQTQSSDQIIQEALAFGESERLESPRAARRRAKTEFSGLTAREREVAALIAQGSSNREIAAALFVGLKTIEAHISHILSKLGFTSRAQIAAWAVNRGLVPPPQVEM